MSDEKFNVTLESADTFPIASYSPYIHDRYLSSHNIQREREYIYLNVTVVMFFLFMYQLAVAFRVSVFATSCKNVFESLFENLFKKCFGHSLLELNPLKQTLGFMCFALCQPLFTSQRQRPDWCVLGFCYCGLLGLKNAWKSKFILKFKPKQQWNGAWGERIKMEWKHSQEVTETFPTVLYSRTSLLCFVYCVGIFDLISGARLSSNEWQLRNAGVSIWGVCLLCRLIRATDTRQSVVHVWFGA